MTAYRTKPIAVQAWNVGDITKAACESQATFDALPEIVRDALNVGMLRTVKFWLVDGIGLNVFAGGPTEEPLQAKPDMMVSVDEQGGWYAWESADFFETHEAVTFVDTDRAVLNYPNADEIRARLTSIVDPQMRDMAGVLDMVLESAVGAAAQCDDEKSEWTLNFGDVALLVPTQNDKDRLKVWAFERNVALYTVFELMAGTRFDRAYAIRPTGDEADSKAWMERYQQRLVDMYANVRPGGWVHEIDSEDEVFWVSKRDKTLDAVMLPADAPKPETNE